MELDGKAFPIAGAPMQAVCLPNINDVPRAGENEQACLREVAAVLRRFNCLSRYGVTLLHQHFQLDDDEVLLESNDPEARTLLIRPVKKNEIDKAVITSWRFDTGQPMMSCACLTDANGNHSHQHQR